MATTAEVLIQDLKKLPDSERQRFFLFLSESAFRSEDMTHEQLFGHLAEDHFTAQDAAEYLEVSMSTFRRLVMNVKLKPTAVVGRNQMFSLVDLRAFKLARKAARR